MSNPLLRTTVPLIALPALLLLVVALGVRLGEQRERVALARYGTHRQKMDLCRLAPALGPSHGEDLLKLLLQAPATEVRLSALTGCERIGHHPALDARLEQMLRDEQEVAAVRARAGAVLLRREEPQPSVMAYLARNLAEASWRANFPTLAAAYIRRRLPEANETERRQWLRNSLDANDPCCEPLRTLIGDCVTRFRHCRDDLLQALDDDPPAGTREYVLSLLTAIDGRMRGATSADWRQQTAALPKDRTHAIMESEWVQQIKPNYQIMHHRNERCLALGEGAGGRMHWLGDLDGTVDIGSGRFSLYAPRDDDYSFWARCWLDDKCGNSFGLTVDGRRLGNFPDKSNQLVAWHWLLLTPQQPLRLTEGLHDMRIEAWEDGVYLDKFALLPAGRSPEDLGKAPAVFWDPSLRSSLSFTLEQQAQRRGTTQDVTVWVRRSDPSLRSGEVRLQVPSPFVLIGEGVHQISFAPDDPLARTTFRVLLPPDAVAGEAWMAATYVDDSRRDDPDAAITQRFILGAQHDWLTTGPVQPGEARYHPLQMMTRPTDEELGDGWSRYPAEGYDRYRRLTPERAYGQLQGCSIWLCTDIRVEADGEYLALLTVDDTAVIHIDGRLAVQQHRGGPGEGRLRMVPLELQAGTHRLLARVNQAGFTDPHGADAGRHSQNHCSFKLLLRRARHEPAPGIKHLPWDL